MTNTETSKNDEKTKRSGNGIGYRLIVLIIDIIMFVVFVTNAYFIFKGNFDFGTVTFGTVAFFFLIADSVRQGIGWAFSALPIYAAQGSDDDTPTR